MKKRSIAIIGGGPAGAALAQRLTRQGFRVGLFTLNNRPELTVGESLVPAIVTHLRELGVEEEVKSYSTYKPGATFFMRDDQELTFSFDGDRKRTPPYAYNVPRKDFDQTLLNAAVRAGTEIFYVDAKVLADPTSGRLSLARETLDATGGFFSDGPDFIVDGSGRRRLVAKLLDLPTVTGKRRDTVLFAHLDQTELTHPGNIHVNRLAKGWAWRIPLPGRVSVGIVAPAEHVESMGKGLEEQYERLLEVNPAIKKFVGPGKRVTRVFRYTNYNLRTHRLFGPNWALVGDAAGFIDPVFSSGLQIGLAGAKFLFQALLTAEPKDFEKYQDKIVGQLKAWEHIVDQFYNGRFFTVMEAGEQFKKSLFGAFVGRHVHRHVSRVMTGTATTVPYSRGLLNFLFKHGLRNGNPEEVCIG